MLFEVLADGVLIGRSALEYGDPPMGVAIGTLHVCDAYSQFKSAFVVPSESESQSVRLTVRVAGSADDIECVGVGVSDGTAEFQDEPIQVEVLGIPYPRYGELFPHHVLAYERQISGGVT